jgi:non-specific serine/threonine protein kinase
MRGAVAHRLNRANCALLFAAGHSRPFVTETLDGRYRITRKLGEGGMGVVFAGHDDRLGRAVAIKMIRQATSTPAARERLWREARAAARVSHPNVCQIFEIGEAQDQLFITMELLEGESLAARLARGPIALGECVPIAMATLSALGAIHKSGIVHRDLKPSNVFLTPHAVKLLDFGLARPVDDDPLGEGQTQAGLTLAGTIIGTPRYMSPEQAMGQPLDERSDLFAAAIVIYEMLTGRPPFGGDNPVQVMHAVMYDEVPALAGSAAVAAVDRVLHRAMAKSPGGRYSSADAMALDLRSAAELADSGDVPQIRAMTRLIVLPFRMLRPDPDTEFLSFSLPDALSASLSGLESLVVRSSLTAARFAADAPDFRRISEEADVDIVLTGMLLRAGDELRVTAQLADAAAGTLIWSHTAQAAVGDLFHLQDSLVERIVESLALPLTVREHRRLKRDAPASATAYEFYLRANQIVAGARVWTDVGTWTMARELYARSLEEDPRFAPAWVGQGRVHRVLAKYSAEESSANFERAETAFKRALELNPELSHAHNLYAQLEIDLGRAREAMVRLLGRARIRGNDPEAFVALCTACRYTGLLPASIAAYECARRLDPKVSTSVIQTYFVMGDDARVVEISEGPYGGYGYIGLLALAGIGREADAIAAARKMEATALTRFRALVTAARHLIEGNRVESVKAAEEAVAGAPDPELMFYAARMFARQDETRRALEEIARASEAGYCSYLQATRDPWLDSLRGDPGFHTLVGHLREQHEANLAAFREAGGPAILGAEAASE